MRKIKKVEIPEPKGEMKVEIPVQTKKADQAKRDAQAETNKVEIPRLKSPNQVGTPAATRKGFESPRI